jgi:hypothetical protein
MFKEFDFILINISIPQEKGLLKLLLLGTIIQ